MLLTLLACVDTEPLCRSPIAGIDRNCDGVDDEDGDGDGDAGLLAGGSDCDDADPELNGLDVDGDGSSTCDGDCDETGPDASLRGPRGVTAEACDDVDNDCNFVVDVDDLGDSPCAQSETFTRPSRVKLDVVFVVDNRSSMYEEAGRLPAAADAVLGPLVGTDTHLGVATNVGGLHGRFHAAEGGDPWLDLEDEAIETATAWWLSAAYLDPRGAHANEILRSAEDVVLLQGDGANLGFRRPDAPLVYVLVTDGDDESALTFDAFAIFTQNPQWFAEPAITHAVAPTPDSVCVTPGEKISLAVLRTNGTILDVCADDWTAFLSGIATQEAPAYEVRVGLSITPIPSTLTAVVTHDDGREETIEADALVWEPFTREVVVPQYPWGELLEVRIEFQRLPD